MNWVGGARSRVKMRDEQTKQKEYFEKKRYQNKVRRLEKPSSPRKRKLPLSTDLLSLQAANYSAQKFSTNDSSSPISRGKVTRVDLNQSRSSLVPFHRLDDIELPMSPGAPSKLLLQEAGLSMDQECTNTKEIRNAEKNFVVKQQSSNQFGRMPSQHNLSQVSLKSTRQQDIFPEKYLPQDMSVDSRHCLERKVLPTSVTSQQHSFLKEERTPRPGWKDEKQPFDRVSENLFFQFLPSVTSTIQRPSCSDEADVEIVEIQRCNESPISYKSDISCVGSSQTTVNSHDEEELLVPQMNPSSPATSVSSLWEAGSISSFDNMSSDNINNSKDNQTKTTTIDKRHGRWSSTGEDTPHLSDSSLTTFRQYHRKKLKRSISQTSPDTPHILSKSPHTPSKPYNQQKRRVDLICHEPLDFISPILHRSQEKDVITSPTCRMAMEDTIENTRANHLLSTCTESSVSTMHRVFTSTEKPSQEVKVNVDLSSKSSINPNDSKVMGGFASVGNSGQTSPSTSQNTSNISESMPIREGGKSAVSSETHGIDSGEPEEKDLEESSLSRELTQAAPKEGENGKASDEITTNWKTFLGGSTEADLSISSKSGESSQVSCEEITDDRQHVSNQVLLEVMALDKKINESIISHSDDIEKIETAGVLWPLMHDQEKMDCLEVFSAEMDNSQKLVFLEGQVSKSQPESCSPEVDVHKSHFKEDCKKSASTSFEQDELNQSKEELEIPTCKKIGDEQLVANLSEQHDNFGQSKNFDSDNKGKQFGISSTVETSISTSSVLGKKEHTRTQSTQTVLRHSEPDTNLENLGGTGHPDYNKDVLHRYNLINHGNKGTGGGTQPTLLKGTNREIQCQLLTSNTDPNCCDKCKNPQTVANKHMTLIHASVQTSQENTDNQYLPAVAKQGVTVVNHGTQCDMCLVEIMQMDERHVARVAGGRINNREHKAYGPPGREGYDTCCVS